MTIITITKYDKYVIAATYLLYDTVTVTVLHNIERRM